MGLHHDLRGTLEGGLALLFIRMDVWHRNSVDEGVGDGQEGDRLFGDRVVVAQQHVALLDSRCRGPLDAPCSRGVMVGQLYAKSWRDNYTRSATMCGNHGCRRSQAMAQLRKIAVFLLKTTSVFLLDKSRETSFKNAESCLLLAFSQSRIVERHLRAAPLAASSHLHDVLPAKQSILLDRKVERPATRQAILVMRHTSLSCSSTYLTSRHVQQ